MALIGLAAAAAQAKEVDLPKPSFPPRTTSVPLLKRDISAVLANSPLRPSSGQHKPGFDWRLFLTVEERQMIRQKISAGYEGRAKTYEELLKICSAIEEELVFISAPSRLDYFKTGLQFDKRVTEKQRQFMGDSVTASSPEAPALVPVDSSGTDQGNGQGLGHSEDTDGGAACRPAKKVRVSPQLE